VGTERRGIAAPYRFRPPMEPDDTRAAAGGEAESVLRSDLADEPALRRVVEILAAAHPAWGWVGVYLLAGDTLVLGPFVGPPTEHTRIPVGVGVCGSAAATDANVDSDEPAAFGPAEEALLEHLAALAAPRCRRLAAARRRAGGG
jgi:putative methionine-R-sulfoxide reductase with GAF domain